MTMVAVFVVSGTKGSRPTSDETLSRIKGNLGDTLTEEEEGKQQLRPPGWPFSRERQKLSCSATNLRAQRMDWASGTPTRTWFNVEGKKEF
mmetsp:Transcript_20601/g.37787  ORF Transcript_20601/g.37787 Transcript_20601/m.37787 type:complete len:91 (-) Transcript_20601:144-416(-)